MLHGCLILTVLHLIFGYENIALNKPTYQSHAYIYNKYGTATFDSSNAVDGLKTDISPFRGQCVISADGYKTATWWVNLTSIYSIHDIRIYYRTDNVPWGSSNAFTTRFLGFYVYVSNTTNMADGHLCFHDTNNTRATIPAVFDIVCPVHGQYVIYYNERPQNSTYSSQYSTNAHNELCEVEVNGCKETGYYGPNCSLPCPRTCRYCHIETGACQGCEPGYQGRRCELPCSTGFYGEVCSEKCGNCSDGVTCNHIKGTCPSGCDVGVHGDKCETPCPSNWHGKNCNDLCRNCDTCDRFTGQCTSNCYTGLKGEYCSEECDGKQYGQDCGQRCGACLGYRQCHYVNGSCLEGCDAGYRGQLCKTACNAGFYGYNCQTECSIFCKKPRDCHHVTGHCNNGCIEGMHGVKCLPVVEKIDSCTMGWPSRFYGVLAALCICIAFIVVLIFYICFTRRKTVERHTCKEQDEGFNERGNLCVISDEETSSTCPYHQCNQIIEIMPFLSDQHTQSVPGCDESRHLQ